MRLGRKWIPLRAYLRVAGVVAFVVVAPWPAQAVRAAATAEQITPAIAYNSHEERQDYFIVWTEDRGARPDIYAKRLFRNGLPQGGPDKNGWLPIRSSGAYQRSEPPPGPRANPDVVYNGQREEFLLVFSERASEIDGWDVFAVRIAASGYSVGNPRVIAGGPGDQQRPDVALIGDDGEYLVVFDDNSRDIDIVGAVRVRANGIPSGRPYVMIELPSNTSDPSTNGSVVAWVDDRNGNSDIYAQRINENGLPERDDYPIARTVDEETSPNFGAGQLVWNVFDPATGMDIRGAQVYDNGMTRGRDQGILVPASDQSWPATAEGGLVIFSDNRSGEFDLYGIRLANGRSRGREFPILQEIGP
jgi:hypothetical protein